MSGRSPSRGFTLVEVLVVFVILAAVTALAIPAFRDPGDHDDLTAATATLHSLFRIARDSAVRGGTVVTVLIDSVSHDVWLDAAPPEDVSTPLSAPAPIRMSALRARSAAAMPPGTPLDLPVTISLQLSSARARFTFLPGGIAFGDTLVLRHALGMRAVTISPFTGDVVLY